MRTKASVVLLDGELVRAWLAAPRKGRRGQHRDHQLAFALTDSANHMWPPPSSGIRWPSVQCLLGLSLPANSGDVAGLALSLAPSGTPELSHAPEPGIRRFKWRVNLPGPVTRQRYGGGIFRFGHRFDGLRLQPMLD